MYISYKDLPVQYLASPLPFSIIFSSDMVEKCLTCKKKIWRRTSYTRFGSLRSESDNVQLVLCEIRYAKQKTETENAKNWRHGFFNFLQLGNQPYEADIATTSFR